MTREEVIKLAKQSGLFVELVLERDLDWLERFAALVASAEREKVAAWMMQCGYATGHGDTIEDLLKEFDWQAKEREREACAKVAQSYEPCCDTCPSGVTNAIRARARGQA